MSKLQVDQIVNKEDTGSPTLPKGVVVTGVTTSTSFSGNVNAGVVTATSFVGDGSALTGITVPAGTDWRDGSLF